MRADEILKRRINFYLDSDNVCRWKYVGVEYLPAESPIRKRGKVVLGVCEVCGKTPIYNNFILKYMAMKNILQELKYQLVQSVYISLVRQTC